MIPLSQVAKEIDALERHGMTRPEAERAFWAMYRFVERISNSPASFGAQLEAMLHPKTKVGIMANH